MNLIQRKYSGRRRICLPMVLVFGLLTISMMEGVSWARPIDPSLERLLAPTVKHAIGIRKIAPDLTHQWSERFGREPAFIQSFGIKLSWKAFREAIPHTLTDDWPKKKQTYIYTIQMLRKAPMEADEIPQALRQKYPKDPTNLEAAADGMYDEQWAWFGKLLNQYSQADLDKLVLRPGHEFNGDWYMYSTKPKQSTPEISAKQTGYFKIYWQRIHKVVMKELNGKRVLWDFCPSGSKIRSSKGPPEVENAYPGDEYVDIIGMDRYSGSNDSDGAGNKGWEDSRKTCFAWQSQFAAEHGKMTAIDETNITYILKNGKNVGSDDYPGWFEGLNEWAQQEVDARRLHHITLFETDIVSTGKMWHACLIRRKPIPGRENQELNFPKSAAKIIELWGGKL